MKCQNNSKHEDYIVSCDLFSKGSRCPMCNESRGERLIRNYLIENNVTFQPQKKFNFLKGVGGHLLSYDFYLSSHNLLIEYQWKQHYEPTQFTNQSKNEIEEQFKIQQEHDRRKREYAELNNITLLEIPYWDYDNVDSILAKALNITNTNTKDNDTNDNNNINNFTNINTYNQSSSDNVYTKVKVNKEEFDFPTVEEIMKM